MKRIALLVALLFLHSRSSFGQTAAPILRDVRRQDKPVVAALPTPTPVTPVQNQEKTADINIVIEPSRTQTTAGGTFSLSAVLKNMAAKSVTLTGRKTTLFLPPELAGSDQLFQCTQFAYFPTEGGNPDFSFDSELTIAPGESYTVVWMLAAVGPSPTPPPTSDLGSTQPTAVLASSPTARLHSEQQVTSPTPTQVARPHHLRDLFNGMTPAFLHTIAKSVGSEMQFVFFPPGDYKVAAVISYHLDGDPDETMRTVTQGYIVHVAAPQSVILFGAAIGGLLGYIITLLFLSDLGLASQKATLASFLRFMTGAFGSILLSAMVTILLARLSETQFLIRVSINDFWGAIAIGFVVNLIGIKVLDKILSGTGVATRKALALQSATPSATAAPPLPIPAVSNPQSAVATPAASKPPAEQSSDIEK